MKNEERMATFNKQELTENEKKLQGQIDKLLAEIEDLKKERDYYKNAYYDVWDSVLNDPMIGGYSLAELDKQEC